MTVTLTKENEEKLRTTQGAMERITLGINLKDPISYLIKRKDTENKSNGRCKQIGRTKMAMGQTHHQTRPIKMDLKDDAMATNNYKKKTRKDPNAMAS